VTDTELIEAVRPQLEAWAKLVARRAAGQSVLDADDLLQEALLAAVASRATWREDGGASLTTHALNRGRGEVIDALRRSARDCRRNQRQGGTYRIARVRHLSAVAALLETSQRPADETSRWEPEAPPEQPPFSRAEFVKTLRRLTGILPRDRDVLARRFADDMPVSSLTGEFNLSEARLFAIVTNACTRIANCRQRHEVAELLGLS